MPFSIRNSRRLVYLPRRLQSLVGTQRDLGVAAHVAHPRYVDGQFLVAQVHRPWLRAPAAQRLIRPLALIPRPGQLNNRPLQLFRDRLQTQGNQPLDRLDPAIQILYLPDSLGGCSPSGQTRLFRADSLLTAGSFCYRYETSSEGFPVSVTKGACAVSTNIGTKPYPEGICAKF